MLEANAVAAAVEAKLEVEFVAEALSGDTFDGEFACCSSSKDNGPVRDLRL